MRVAILLTALLLCAYVPLRATASEDRASSPAYKVIDHVIEGLARANAALDDVNAKSKASLVDRMTAVQNASIELGVVNKYIEPFASSRNANLAGSIRSQITAYEAMQQALGITLSLYEQLDAPKSEDDLVGMRRKISDAKVLYQQASAILVEATAVTFASGVVPDPQDPENHVALAMSSEQRKQLIVKLDDRFAQKLRREKREDDTGPLQAARLLLTLLERGWRVAA
jgi:hypothetical protein